MKQRFLTFIDGIFKDENGVISSKRFVGVIGALSLIVYSFIYPSEYANSSVLLMSLGSLGITGLESIFKKNK
jgi:uncharacterized membrane protein